MLVGIFESLLAWLPGTSLGLVSCLIGIFGFLLILRILKTLWDALPVV